MVLVSRPWPGVLEERRLVDSTGAVIVEHALHVALEHFERKHDILPQLHKFLEQSPMQSMAGKVVVLFAEKDKVAARKFFASAFDQRPGAGKRTSVARPSLSCWG